MGRLIEFLLSEQSNMESCYIEAVRGDGVIRRDKWTKRDQSLKECVDNYKSENLIEFLDKICIILSVDE